jgi:NAD(P)-dependent dehydrogenase (short-subunit alcohol dehydrogenase family)
MRALIAGGGRGVGVGIGAGIARALAGGGSDVVVGARTRDQIEAVADEIGGRWVEVEVAGPGSVEYAVAAADSPALANEAPPIVWSSDYWTLETRMRTPNPALIGIRPTDGQPPKRAS